MQLNRGSYRRLLVYFLALLGAVVVGGEAMANRQTTSPSGVVRKYCQLDFDGSRLSSAMWKRVSPLVSWEDEPGWDTYTVVSGFQILSEKQSKDEATISVSFSVVGTMSGDGPLKKEGKKEGKKEACMTCQKRLYEPQTICVSR